MLPVTPKNYIGIYPDTPIALGVAGIAPSVLYSP